MVSAEQDTASNLLAFASTLSDPYLLAAAVTGALHRRIRWEVFGDLPPFATGGGQKDLIKI